MVRVAPTAVVPEAKRNEALGIIRGGLQDISITRTSIDWGVPVPWDEEHVFYVWYDALINYLTAIGYGEDDARFEAWWPAVHHLIGKDIIRFHCVWWPAMCMAAGIEPPAHVQVHGWLLVGGEKMSKSSLNQITPAELTADYGVDPVRYHLLRDTPLGTDGDFSSEGITARYNADLANNLGNLLSRVATVVGSKCGGVGPAPDPDSRLAGVAAKVLAEAAAAWDAGLPHLGLEATWRLIRETNAELEAAEPWKAEPGPAVDAVLGSALEVLRIVAVLVVPAMPATAQAIWRRIGLAGSPADRAPAASPRPGAATPAGWRWRRVPRSSPGARADPGDGRRRRCEWFDSHCHLQDEFAESDRGDRIDVTGPTPPGWPARWPGPRRPGSPGWSAWAPTPARRPRRWPWSGPCDSPARRRWPRASSCGPPSASIPMTPWTAWSRSTASGGRARPAGPSRTRPRRGPGPGGGGDRRVRSRLPLRPLAPARPAGGLRRADRPGPRHGLALVIHTREAWDDTFDILAAAGVPARTIVHCFTGGPDEARRCLDLGASLSFSGMVTFKNADDVRRGGGPVPVGPAAGRDRLALPHPGAPSRNPQRTIEGSPGRGGNCPGQRG